MPATPLRGFAELFNAFCMGGIFKTATARFSLFPSIITARFDIKAVTDLADFILSLMRLYKFVFHR